MNVINSNVPAQESHKYISSDLNSQPVYRNDTLLSSNLNIYSMPHNQETPTYFFLNHVSSQPQSEIHLTYLLF
jgi:hypothetical protein